jgi:cbb3-type cytochrome oxidase subunit 3
MADNGWLKVAVVGLAALTIFLVIVIFLLLRKRGRGGERPAPAA